MSQEKPSTAETNGPGRSVLGIVFMTILIDFGGFSVLFPVLPIYAETLGAGPQQVGLMLSLYALAMLIFSPVWGFVSDRIGRRPVLLISLAGTAASFLLLAFSRSVEEIYLARSLSGMFAATIGTAQAIVTDTTGERDRAKGMGVIGAAFGAGMAVGPFLGGTLSRFDPSLPFFGVAALALGNFLLAWWKLPESRPPGLPRPDWKELAATFIPVPYKLATAGLDKRLRHFLFLFFHAFTAFAVLESMITLYVQQRFGADPFQAGLFFGWIGICLAVTQGVVLRRLVPRTSELRLTITGLVAMAIAIGAIPLLPSFAGCFAAGALLALGYGVAFPSFTAMFSKVCRAENAGELLGQSQSMVTTGRIVGPISAGLLMQYVGLGTPFGVAGVLMGLAAWLVWHWRRELVPE